MNIVNVTPHTLNFMNQDGSEFEVPVSGSVINATAVDVPMGHHPSGAELVAVRFVANDGASAILDKIESENPGAVIIGSLIAAQAFPGRIFAMQAFPGFERRPPAEKRMRTDRFTVFPL